MAGLKDAKPCRLLLGELSLVKVEALARSVSCQNFRWDFRSFSGLMAFGFGSQVGIQVGSSGTPFVSPGSQHRFCQFWQYYEPSLPFTVSTLGRVLVTLPIH